MMPQHEARIVGGAVPFALLEISARSKRHLVKFTEIEVVLRGVSDAVIKVTHRQAVIPVFHCEVSKIRESAGRVILKIVRQREPQTFFELDASSFLTDEQLRAPDIVQGMD